MRRSSKRIPLAITIVLSLTAAAGLGGVSCSADLDASHPYGDSRYGKSSLALTVPSGDPYLDFDQDAADPTEIALTFDDGPDVDGATKSVLDTLRSKGVHATFFVNSKNYVDVASSPAAQALIRRMASEGHQIGNHSVDHKDMSLTSTDVHAELAGVDDMLHTFAPSFASARLVRAPYGDPYFGPQARLDVVSPIVAQYGVHVGWNIDSLDWKCDGDGMTSSCVRSNVLTDVDAGKSGIILMHCVNALTAQVLPTLIDDLRSRGKRFVDVDTLVREKYGDVSRHLFFCGSDSDCISSERCGSNGHCGGSSGTDAGPDTGRDTGGVDSGVADTATDVGTTGDGGTSSTSLKCSAFTVLGGTIGGSATACSGAVPVLAANDTTVLSYVASASTRPDGYATYASPYDASTVTGANVTVAFRGDDETEPLWYWYARNATTGAWDVIGDNSWATNWTTSTHTFTLATPSRYVDASGRILVRFTTLTSTNDAELDEMIVRVTTSTPGSDAGDAGAVVDVVSCSTLTLVSGSLYGSSTTACSGATPSLATVNGAIVGWRAKTGATKSSAYATYQSPVGASRVTGMSLLVTYTGDDASEPPWSWSAKNATTGVWELVGDNSSWAGNWVSTNHTFIIASPSRYVAADGAVEILFTTTASTNDAELDRMSLQVTH